jgi:predicted phage replisome organizer
MGEIKWIKITTDWFNDSKIKQLKTMPDRFAVTTVWFCLLGLAGMSNNYGKLTLGEVPYDERMLANEFDIPEHIVNTALVIFKRLGMVEILDGENCLYITNWGKHQNVDGMEKLKIQWKEASQKYRNKNKLINHKPSYDASYDVIQQNKNIDIDKEYKNKNKDNNKNINTSSSLSQGVCKGDNENKKPDDVDDDVPTVKIPKIFFDYETAEFQNIPELKKELWTKSYPAVDIDQALNAMASWLISDRKRAKINYDRFIVNWLSRTQDKGGNRKDLSQSQKFKSFSEIKRENTLQGAYNIYKKLEQQTENPNKQETEQTI